MANTSEAGAYQDATADQIRATVALLQHFRAFLASDCAEMRDPISGWADDRLTKDQARRRLAWLVNVAILRRAGWIEDRHSREIAPANHRGSFPRRRTGDAQRHLRQLADKINRPRLVVRPRETGEWCDYLSGRIPGRFTDEWGI